VAVLLEDGVGFEAGAGVEVGAFERFGNVLVFSPVFLALSVGDLQVARYPLLVSPLRPVPN
jgi:hypothetical protein